MIQIHSETTLVADAAQGNREAYGQLVRKYQDRLMTTVYHVVRDRADAEDLCQEAFLRAYVHLREFEGRSTFYTWLCRIALNLAIGAHRRRKRLSSLESRRQSTAEEPADRGDLPGDRLVRKESQSQIQEALAALTADQRAVVVLRAVDGLNYQEISQVLDLNIGTVRSRLHRARTQLRDWLQTASAG